MTDFTACLILLHAGLPKGHDALNPHSLTGDYQAAQPKSLKPQLVTLVKEVPQGGDWLHEIKYDGYRMLFFVDHGKARMISRNGLDWTARFQRITGTVAVN